MTLISFHNADIIAGGNVVVHGLDMEVEKGDLAYILGKVGSGKTSIIRCSKRFCANISEISSVRATFSEILAAVSDMMEGILPPLLFATENTDAKSAISSDPLRLPRSVSNSSMECPFFIFPTICLHSCIISASSSNRYAISFAASENAFSTE